MKRKLMALLLIVCMMCGSSLTVFASGATEMTTASGNTVVSGNGTVEYKNTTVYKVKLPTNESIGLVIDPQGLSQLESDGSASKEELASGAGVITSVKPMYVANMSSVSMNVSVSMNITGDATAVASANDIKEAGTANEVLLYAVPSAVDTQGSTSENYAASTTGLVLVSDYRTANFLVDAAEYVFKSTSGNVTYVEKENGAKHGFAIKLEGLVNTEADWSEYSEPGATKHIGYEVTFSFKPAESSDRAISDNGVYGLIEYDGGNASSAIKLEAKEVAPTFTAGSTPGTIEYTVGTGKGAVVAVTKVEMENGGTWYDGYNPDTQTGYDVWGSADDSDGVITLSAEYLSCFVGVDTKDAKVTYTTANGTNTVTVSNVKMK